MTLEQARGQFSPGRGGLHSERRKGPSHGDWSMQWAGGYRVPNPDAVAYWGIHGCTKVSYEIKGGTTIVPGVDVSSLIEHGQKLPTHVYLQTVNPVGFTVVIVNSEEKLPKAFREGRIARPVFGNDDVLVIKLNPEEPIIQPILRFTAAGDGRFGVSLKALPMPEKE